MLSYVVDDFFLILRMEPVEMVILLVPRELLAGVTASAGKGDMLYEKGDLLPFAAKDGES